jgi:hypothetical protein
MRPDSNSAWRKNSVAGQSRSYWKDGTRQDTNELLKCSFTQAKNVLEVAADSKRVEGAWISRFTGNYEFEDE